jgi:hypothetical protein
MIKHQLLSLLENVAVQSKDILELNNEDLHQRISRSLDLTLHHVGLCILLD